MFCPFSYIYFTFTYLHLKEGKLKNAGISFTAVTLYTWSAGDKWGDEELFRMCLLKTDSSSLTTADSITLGFYLI